jgi:hypothetical protein
MPTMVLVLTVYLCALSGAQATAGQAIGPELHQDIVKTTTSDWLREGL